MRFFLILILTGLGAFFKVEAQDSNQAGNDSNPDNDFRNGIEQQTFYLINQYRKDHDLPPLEWNSAVAKLAREHSRDMATGVVDFGHDGFGDRVSQLKSAMTGLRGAGENVFESDVTSDLAQLAVTTWLHSPHHLKNIRGDYTCSGLGVWQNKDGAVYFTQIFVKIQAPSQQAQATPLPAVITPFGYLTTPTAR